VWLTELELKAMERNVDQSELIDFSLRGVSSKYLDKYHPYASDADRK
jgi:hypothetical protein